MAHVWLVRSPGTAGVLTTSVLVRQERGSAPWIGSCEQVMPSHGKRPAAFGSEDLPSQAWSCPNFVKASPRAVDAALRIGEAIRVAIFLVPKLQLGNACFGSSVSCLRIFADMRAHAVV